MQIKPSATMTVSARAAELLARGHDIISLGVGEPDFDTPDHIRRAAIEAMEAGETRYTPVDGTVRLKNAIIKKLGSENQLEFGPDQVIVSNGAKQSLYNLMVSLLNLGDEVILPAPYWVSYPDMIKLAEGLPVILNATAEANFKITPKQLEASLTDLSRLLILNSPSNPTGKVYTESEYRALAEVLIEHPKVMVACDDIYEHIYWGEAPYRTLLNVCPELSARTIIINGVSKAFAMTGWRIGYAAGPAEVVTAMRKIQMQSTSGASSISQAAAAAALEGSQKCVRQMCAAYQQRYEYLVEALNGIDGVECPGCEGAFYVFPSFRTVIERLPGIRDDVELAAWMLEHAGVAMVPGTAFGAPGHLRLSFATSLENLRTCIGRIEKALSQPA
jgi:aspartate aminotransferase